MIGDIYIYHYIPNLIWYLGLFFLLPPSQWIKWWYTNHVKPWDGMGLRIALLWWLTGSHVQSFKQIVHHQLHSLLKLVHVLKKLKGCLDCFWSQKIDYNPNHQVPLLVLWCVFSLLSGMANIPATQSLLCPKLDGLHSLHTRIVLKPPAISGLDTLHLSSKETQWAPPPGVPMRKDRGHGGSAGPAEATFLMEISRGNCFDSGIIWDYFTVVWIVFGLWLCLWLHYVGLLTDGDFRMADCRCSMGILTGCANDVIGLHENIGCDGIGWNSCRNLIGCLWKS